MKNLNKKTKYILFLLLIFSITFLNVSHFSLAGNDDEETELTEEQKEELEKKKEEEEEKEEELEEKKDKIEDKIEKEENQKNNLQKDLNIVQQSLNSTQQSLEQTKDEIKNKEHEINRHNKQIELLNQKNKLYQEALASALRNFYYQQNESAVYLAFKNEGNSKFLGSSDSFDNLRNEVLNLVDEINETKRVTQDKKESIEDVKKEKETLLLSQKQQENSLVSEKNQTQAQIISKNATISELNAKLAAVESDLSGLLGESVEAGDIVEAVEIASKKTGVRKAFLFGELIQETDLGRYTGGCTYKKANMHSYDIPVFKRIMSDLDYKSKEKKVSCGVEGKYYGGAMGVAQFIPTTWQGYELKIEKYTGHSPADPWSLTDGVMAMAIKLANDGATSKSGEYDAARKYYCGSRLSRKVCVDYANDVMYWSKNYKDKL